jgi:hypothetical protein
VILKYSFINFEEKKHLIKVTTGDKILILTNFQSDNLLEIRNKSHFLIFDQLPLIMKNNVIYQVS